MERTHAFLISSGLPNFLWAEAASHAVWLMNRVSTHAVTGKTPFELATESKPHLVSLQEWGMPVWVYVKKKNKLQPRAKLAHFVGYDTELKAIRVYWKDSHRVSVE
jgi:hypothetical protein